MLYPEILLYFRLGFSKTLFRSQALFLDHYQKAVCSSPICRGRSEVPKHSCLFIFLWLKTTSEFDEDYKVHFQHPIFPSCYQFILLQYHMPQMTPFLSCLPRRPFPAKSGLHLPHGLPQSGSSLPSQPPPLLHSLQCSAWSSHHSQVMPHALSTPVYWWSLPMKCRLPPYLSLGKSSPVSAAQILCCLLHEACLLLPRRMCFPSFKPPALSAGSFLNRLISLLSIAQSKELPAHPTFSHIQCLP